jgi:Ni/Fe-hydrogenase subunit HybB-like protein
MLIAGPRLHLLWNTPLIPLLFLISCIGMGYAMVVFESAIGAAYFKRQPETKMLAGLGGAMVPIMGAFVVLRFADLAMRGRLGLLFAMDRFSLLTLLELALAIVPVVMLVSRERRQELSTLFRASILLILGGALYRFDTYLVAFQPGAHWSYFPNVPELLVTIALVTFEIMAYVAIVRYFPILGGMASRPTAPARAA